MHRGIFSRRYRPAWVVGALVVLIAVGFALPPVRSLAGDLLALFRMQRIEFIDVDLEKLGDAESLQAALRRFEGVLDEQVRIAVQGAPQEADVASARELAGFVTRFPAALGTPSSVMVAPPVQAEAEIDLVRVRALLTELGYAGVDLPDTLDGALVSVAFQSMVSARYGPCDRDVGAALPDGCTEYAQLPAPVVEAPAELELERLGQVYLQLLGLSEDEARRFSERVDWTTTLLVPLPRSTGLRYSDVSIGALPGTIVRPPSTGAYAGEYLLTWIDDGIVYALHGTGSTAAALELARSVR